MKIYIVFDHIHNSVDKVFDSLDKSIDYFCARYADTAEDKEIVQHYPLSLRTYDFEFTIQEKEVE